MEKKLESQQLRSPIVTVCGHVDHGKTSLLDSFRGTSVQEEEAGGITQKISFTKYPSEQICRSCPLIDKSKVKLEIPGFLFIDTPGHAAFTHLRKRGGSLADLAILVVSIKEGIKPQTIEVLQILRANKTPFLIALNKIDSISGWTYHTDLELKESMEQQAVHAKQEFEEAILMFQGSLKEHGFDSDLYYEVSDFTKKIAIVPCSAKTQQGISELLFVLCGLCQRFLKHRLIISEIAKGVILEIKKDKRAEYVEAILYDGSLDEGDELVIANFGEPIISKVRSIQDILPLSYQFKMTKQVIAASGVRVQLTDKEGILPGMPFQEVREDMQEIKDQFKKDIAGVLHLDKQGIIVKADSLGSLEALLTLLKQEHILVLKAGIGPINKSDIASAKANLEINSLDAAVAGFNTVLEDDVEVGNIKILTNEVIYKLIEDLQIWRKEKQDEIEREKLMSLATICKLEILHKHVFRNSNPAIFGIRVLAGKVRLRIPLINENGEEIARIKSLQIDKTSVEEAKEGDELAISLPGITFDRKLKETKYLYSDMSENQVKNFKKNKDLLSTNELKILQEIVDIKSKKKEGFGSTLN